MILIDEILIESPVVKTAFACDLKKCKGACCWEGDFGAPVEEEEAILINKVLPQLLPLLSNESIAHLKNNAPVKYYPPIKSQGTPLLEDQSCVYLIKGEDYATCAFEVLYAEGSSEFKKPISCQLYPIRIEKNHQTGMSLLRYDDWEICKPAKQKGANQKIALHTFVKDALVRKYGQEFFERLEVATEGLND